MIEAVHQAFITHASAYISLNCNTPGGIDIVDFSLHVQYHGLGKSGSNSIPRLVRVV